MWKKSPISTVRRKKTGWRNSENSTQRSNAPLKFSPGYSAATGALILGCGMCMAMEVIGGGIALGVIIGMAGIAVVSANYPIYSAMLSSRKSKYADEIMSMGREITGGEN